MRPGVGYSTEPPEDIAEGDAWVGQLVNAVAHSAVLGLHGHLRQLRRERRVLGPRGAAGRTGYGARTPMIIISPYARRGVFGQQTTNVSILSFMQKLWGMPALTSLNASQNDLYLRVRLRADPAVFALRYRSRRRTRSGSTPLVAS